MKNLNMSNNKNYINQENINEVDIIEENQTDGKIKEN